MNKEQLKEEMYKKMHEDSGLHSVTRRETAQFCAEVAMKYIPKWVSVEDELPKQYKGTYLSKQVIVKMQLNDKIFSYDVGYADYTNIPIVIWYDAGNNQIRNVVEWCPLPKPTTP